MITKDYGETNFITGMRAFAALAVVLIHSGGAGLRELGQFGNSLADLGRTGVYVFFVISGFSVAQSFEHSSGYLDYLRKRLWRIAPLYYFWIIAAILMGTTTTYWQQKFGVSIDAYNLLMHLSFLSFTDYRIANSILGVEWSIPIEVFWYFLIPLLVIRTRASLAVILLAASTFYLILKTHAEGSGALALHWSPLPYLASYCFGVLAYKLRKHPSGLAGDMAIISAVALLILYAAKPHWFVDELLFISAITFAVILFGSERSVLTNAMLNNKPAIFLGTISYGIYLSHMPIIQLLGTSFAATALLAIAVSTLTLYLIERPGMALGRRFKLREKLTE